MRDGKALFQEMRRFVKKFARFPRFFANEVNAQRDAPARERPDVKVMKGSHAD